MNNYKLANNKLKNKKKNVSVKFSNLLAPTPIGPLLLVLPRLSKEELTKSNFYKKKEGKFIPWWSYTQASLANIKEILKIKEYFSELSDEKVEKVHKIIINVSKLKQQINITTKSPLCKHIIISIDSNNISIFMRSSGKHISNMNCAFKDIKSNNFINFIQSDYKGLIVISNKVTSSLNLLVIELYIKNQNSMNANNVQSMWLPQSKLYLKILSIPYFRKDTNTLIDASYIENVIKTTHVFDNVQIVSKPREVKVSLRSDMAIV